MKNFIHKNWLKACFIFLLSFTLSGASLAQTGNCDCVPNEIIVQLANPANLSAVAEQYGLNPTPIEQLASPAIYRLQITNGQTPPQVVAAMTGDTRLIFSEVNRNPQA